MKRILFVDDEVRVLEGLQRMLRGKRNDWEMVFAVSGAEALGLLEASPFDVVVTDMRMPEMDGAILLQQVQLRFPSVARIVLSGYCEMEAAMRAIPVAHQYLAKPCDAGRLRDTLERACSLGSFLTNEVVRRVVGAIGSLPSPSGASAELLDALRHPDVSLEHVARIIERDVGMTAKILQLANSAFFGASQEFTMVRAAVSYLGLDILKQLVLSLELFRTFRPLRPVAGFSLEEFQKHSRLAANIAARFPAPKSIVSASVVAALLHDAGKLVLAVRLCEQFEQALERSAKDARPLYAVEEELIGTSHAEIGAYLLALWGLPQSIVEAVCRHHRPMITQPDERGLNVPAITHIADALAFELTAGTASGAPPPCGGWNMEYLAALGVAGDVPAWRKIAEQIAKEAG